MMKRIAVLEPFHLGGQYQQPNDYVLGIDASPQHIAASYSNNTMRIHDRTTLISIQVINAHSDAISHIKHVNGQFVTCSRDGSVCVWDVRTSCSTPVMSWVAPNRYPLNCMDTNGTLVVAGTELGKEAAYLVFWYATSVE
jgi:WD40 repeat protein